MRLSAEQRAAAAFAGGPLRVVAGAGTGKTAVITERFRRLVAGGLDPERILVLTFTERAAAEMRHRIAEALDGDAPPHVGTFHALAMRWLREEGSAIGVSPAFRILEGPERWIALRELMWEMGDPVLVGEERPDDLVSPLLRVLERLKQELVPLERLEAWCRRTPGDPDTPRLLAAAQLFQEHARRCRRQGWLDFDDVLAETVRLLESRPAMRDRYRERFQALLVDEYQDTNLAQERLVELLAPARGSLLVVGDDDQSIYRFRGASRASMERFARTFAGSASLSLGRNRRSPGRVVAAAAALIQHNADRLPKHLTAARAAGPWIEVLRCADGESEATAIAELVRGLSGVAVLCRTNAIARPIADALRRAGVPFQHRAGQGLYQLPEVRDAVAMLRWLADPGDLLAMARVVTRPPLQMDLRACLAAVGEASAGAPALEVLARQSGADPFLAELCELAGPVGSLGVDELFFEVMTRTRYVERALAPADRARASAALTRLGELIAEHCERTRDHRLSAYLERLDLVLLSGLDEAIPEADPEFAGTSAGECGTVELMTIHQAKGLEFDTVLVPALVEGRLPLHRRGEGFELPAALLEPGVRGREDHLAEERRLLYVAMTRARRRLVLSWAERYEGLRRWRPSRFLEEAAAAGVLRERALVPAEPAAPPPTSRNGSRPAAAPVRLSFSAVSAYRECPRQHWYRYVVRLPAGQSAEAQHGAVVHAALMRAGRLRAAGVVVGPGRLLDLLEEAWSEVEPVDPRRLPALRRLGRDQLERFSAAGGLRARPAMVERSFTTDLDGWRLTGIIDRVDPPPTQSGVGGTPPTGGPGKALLPARPPEGGEAGSTSADELEVGGRPEAWRIVDYKTGTPLPASRLRRDLQLALYALAAKESLGLDPVDLEIVYLRDGKRVLIPSGPELIGEARRLVGEVADGIRAGEREPRPERRRCSLCPYRAVCEAALAL
ncbi:MAG TPA: ATP-dependent DNA helicase [Candidatus Dormibacteraeota bacterium]